MKDMLGIAAMFGFIALLWFGLSQLDVLPRGLQLPTGEYGALLHGRR